MIVTSYKNVIPSEPIALIGAGGHAKVVLEALMLLGCRDILLYDENEALSGREIFGLEVQTSVPSVDKLPAQVHLAMGHNTARQTWAKRLLASGKELTSVLHPGAEVSALAMLAPGCFIARGAIIAPSAELARGCIVNHGAVVDHDNNIGAYTHIAPNATLGGTVRVGEACLIGSGAVILPGLSLGDRVTVGSGAVVTRSVQAGITVVGIPACDQSQKEKR